MRRTFSPCSSCSSIIYWDKNVFLLVFVMWIRKAIPVESPYSLEMKRKVWPSIVHLSNGRRKWLFKVGATISWNSWIIKCCITTKKLYYALPCFYIIFSINSLFSGSSLPNGTVSSSTCKFDDKIEAASAKMYFHYYGQLLHQQNMLQDYVRTGYISELKIDTLFQSILCSLPISSSRKYCMHELIIFFCS